MTSEIKFFDHEINSPEHKIANQTLTFTGYNADGSLNYSDLGIENLTALYNARVASEASRTWMNNSEVGSVEWREAEERLNFWQGKVAMLEAYKPIASYLGK